MNLLQSGFFEKFVFIIILLSFLLLLLYKLFGRYDILIEMTNIILKKKKTQDS